MPFKKFLIPAGALFLVAYAFYAYSWPGVAVVVGALVMWMLLHFTRMMQVLQRASARPVGTVASAVMLNAKLQPGVTLMHVVAMTKALGALQSPKDAQPEVYRWTDNSESFVTCEFSHGKLVKWEMVRPTSPTESPAQTPAPVGDTAAP
jgi:hypothetical protein